MTVQLALKKINPECYITFANNGQEAIDIISSSSDFDFILMDGNMPVMDGFKAAKIIK